MWVVYIVVVEIFSLIAVVVDGCLIPFVRIIGRVVVMTIYDVFAGLAYSEIARLSEQSA